MRKLHTLDDAVKETSQVVGLCECGCGREMCKQNAIPMKVVRNSKTYKYFKIKHRRYLPGHLQKDVFKNKKLSYKRKGIKLNNMDYSDVERDSLGRFLRRSK